MTGISKGHKTKISDKSPERSSPWQIAKRIATEGLCPRPERYAFVGDDTVVDYWLDGEI